MSNELKPCPFCGTPQEDGMLVIEVTLTTRWKSHVECENCGAAGPMHWDGDGADSARDGAAYVWNDRFGTDVKQPANRRLSN